MSANGISHLSSKSARQLAKLNISQAKRQGKSVSVSGQISGNIDSTKTSYRTRNLYDITQLPTQYTDSGILDNANIGGLIIGRPWTS